MKSKPEIKVDEVEEAVAADPLRKEYHKAFVVNPRRKADLREHNAALLCIDVQYLDAAEGYGVFAQGGGPDEEKRRYYFDRLASDVLPNMGALQECFRRHSLEVIHCRICALTRDGRDRSAGHKRLNLLAAPGSKEADFLPEVAPIGDEIVINKTASGVFSSTNLHYVLNNMGIGSLYLAGVYTNECVETTARNACDLGYFVTVIDDGCATVTPELHQASLANLRDRYARILTTAEAIAEVDRFVEANM